MARFSGIFMAAKRIPSQSRRRLSATSRARRETLAAAKRRNTARAVSGAVAIVLATPLSIAAYMGVETSLPGFETAKSFLAMMADRSPGDRTKGELTKTKKAAAPAPQQRALGTITKPEPPKEFIEAIAPQAPTLQEPAQFAPTISGLGPLLAPPPPGGGGGILFPPSPPGGGGGGPNPPPPPEEPPPPPPPPPPPAVPEPGTWATMLLGFGLTGWVMRRRRRTVAAIVTG
jgi:hypothetical protein